MHALRQGLDEVAESPVEVGRVGRLVIVVEDDVDLVIDVGLERGDEESQRLMDGQIDFPGIRKTLAEGVSELGRVDAEPPSVEAAKTIGS